MVILKSLTMIKDSSHTVTTVMIWDVAKVKKSQAHLSYVVLQRSHTLEWRDTPPQTRGCVGLTGL